MICFWREKFTQVKSSHLNKDDVTELFRKFGIFDKKE